MKLEEILHLEVLEKLMSELTLLEICYKEESNYKPSEELYYKLKIMKMHPLLN